MPGRHAPNGRACAVDATVDVGAEQLVQRFLGMVFDRTNCATDSGIVDQRSHAAEMAVGLHKQFIHIGRFGNISAYGDGAAAGALDGGNHLHGCVVAARIVDHHTVASACAKDCTGCSDAARCPGHDQHTWLIGRCGCRYHAHA